MSLSMILPSRDDVVHLYEIIDTLGALPLKIQILLVDSGSSSSNREVLVDVVNHYAARQLDVSLVSSPIGLGRALAAGFRVARYPKVGWFPTDGQLDICTLKDMCLASQSNDGVFVTRLNYRAVISPSRHLIARLNQFLIKNVLKLEDLDFTGSYVVSAKLIDDLPLAFQTAAVNWAILHKFLADGGEVCELRVRLLRRDFGGSRISLREKIRYPLELIWYSNRYTHMLYERPRLKSADNGRGIRPRSTRPTTSPSSYPAQHSLAPGVHEAEQ